MAEHNITGQEGEKAAVDFLLNKGYQIIKTNWRRGNAEIDIIALKEKIMVFVEVKCRSTADFGAPESFVGIKKERLIIDAADWFMQNQQLAEESRFDIISVIKRENDFKISHLEDAFRSNP